MAERSISPTPLNAATAREPERLLGALLSRYEASGNPGLFRVFREGDSCHVVPRGVIDAQGAEVARGSVLDAPIALEPGHRTLAAIVPEIAEKTGARTGVPMVMASAPTNLFQQTRVHVDGRTSSARALLVRYLGTARLRLSWRLFYGPGMKKYFLNVRIVDPRSRAPSVQSLVREAGSR